MKNFKFIIILLLLLFSVLINIFYEQIFPNDSSPENCRQIVEINPYERNAEREYNLYESVPFSISARLLIEKNEDGEYYIVKLTPTITEGYFIEGVEYYEDSKKLFITVTLSEEEKGPKYYDIVGFKLDCTVKEVVIEGLYKPFSKEGSIIIESK